MVHEAEKELLRMNAANTGDVVGIVAGTQKATGSTNFLRLHVVGADDGAGITHAQLAKRRERRKTPRHKPLPERRKR
jgi:Pyruvate kinase